MELPASNKNGK